MRDVAFIANQDGDFKPIGPLEDLYPLDDANNALEPWGADEEDWQNL